MNSEPTKKEVDELVKQKVEEQMSFYRLKGDIEIKPQCVKIKGVGTVYYGFDKTLIVEHITYLIHFYFSYVCATVRNYFSANQSDHCFSDQEAQNMGILSTSIVHGGRHSIKTYRTIEPKKASDKGKKVDWRSDYQVIFHLPNSLDVINTWFEYKHVYYNRFRGTEFTVKEECYEKLNKDIRKLFYNTNLDKVSMYNVPNQKYLLLQATLGLPFRQNLHDDDFVTDKATEKDYENIINNFSKVMVCGKFEKQPNSYMLWTLDPSITELSRKDHRRLCPGFAFITYSELREVPKWIIKK